jgi:hypothetical protein
MGRDGGMIAFVGEEWWYTSGSVTGIIVRKLHKRKKFGWVVLFVRGLPISPVLSHSFQISTIPWQPFPTSSNHFQPQAIISVGDISSPIIAEDRTVLPGIAQLSQSSLPNMKGLVIYMVTCIYTFHADQGSLESISIVSRYVVL